MSINFKSSRIIEQRVQDPLKKQNPETWQHGQYMNVFTSENGEHIEFPHVIWRNEDNFYIFTGETLGDGGQGYVVKYEHQLHDKNQKKFIKTGSFKAVKYLKQQDASQASDVLIHNELKKLREKGNVCNIIETAVLNFWTQNPDIDTGKPRWIIMDYYPDTLESKLVELKKKYKITFDTKSFPKAYVVQIIKWYTQIKTAIECLENHNLYYLDIKQENVLIDLQGDATLGDIGSIVKTLDEWIGTFVTPYADPEYSSPVCTSDFCRKVTLAIFAYSIIEPPVKTFENSPLLFFSNSVVNRLLASHPTKLEGESALVYNLRSSLELMILQVASLRSSHPRKQFPIFFTLLDEMHQTFKTYKGLINGVSAKLREKKTVPRRKVTHTYS